jgi:hypothetical protein
MEKEFTAKEMIEFAGWFAEEVTNTDLQEYKRQLKLKAEQEYQLYLTLKAKYEAEKFDSLFGPPK